jgi:hypothetical protein
MKESMERTCINEANAFSSGGEMEPETGVATILAKEK